MEADFVSQAEHAGSADSERLQSVAEPRLSRGTAVAVLTVMFEHIFVPTDFSSHADAAVALAIGIAEKFDSHVRLVHACDPPAYAYADFMATPADLVTPLQDAAREMLSKALATLRARYPKSDSLLLFGPAALELLAAIEKRSPDLVVMGTHGRTGVGHLLLGSVSERVVRSASVPVLTVKQGN